MLRLPPCPPSPGNLRKSRTTNLNDLAKNKPRLNVKLAGNEISQHSAAARNRRLAGGDLVGAATSAWWRIAGRVRGGGAENFHRLAQRRRQGLGGRNLGADFSNQFSRRRPVGRNVVEKITGAARTNSY